MPNRSIDAIGGVDSALQAAVLGSRRLVRQESGAVSTGSTTEAEQAKALQQQQQQQQQPTEVTQNQAVQIADNSLRFSIDKDSGRAIAELVDGQGKVLRQMPTEEALARAKAIDKFRGMFVNLKV